MRNVVSQLATLEEKRFEKLERKLAAGAGWHCIEGDVEMDTVRRSQQEWETCAAAIDGRAKQSA